MRGYYLLFSKNEILQPLAAKLSWTHYTIILTLKEINKISYYIKVAIKYNLGKRELINKIKSNEYERLDDRIKRKIVDNQENKIDDLIKNPILIKNSYDYKEISEKILKQLILEDLENFMKELGEGFCFIESEYKIKIGNSYNYIDLLLFNIKYNCYVVIELKVTELRKEHIGQIGIYMNYIDKNIKGINHDKTIGIIICKKDNNFIMEYVSDSRIYETTYILN